MPSVTGNDDWRADRVWAASLDPDAYRDYYSLGSHLGDPAQVVLPVTATRPLRAESCSETLDVELGYTSAEIAGLKNGWLERGRGWRKCIVEKFRSFLDRTLH